MGARGTFVYRDGQLVDKHSASPLRPRGPRSEFPCPHLNRDQINPVRSMLDGRTYDSKSELRGTYKAAGVEEIGTDVNGAIKMHENARPSKPPVTMEDVALAVDLVRQGYKPEPLGTEAQLNAIDAGIGAYRDEAA